MNAKMSYLPLTRWDPSDVKVLGLFTWTNQNGCVKNKRVEDCSIFIKEYLTVCKAILLVIQIDIHRITI